MEVSQSVSTDVRGILSLQQSCGSELEAWLWREEVDALRKGCVGVFLKCFYFILSWVLVAEIVVATGRDTVLKVTYSVVPYGLAYRDNWINMWVHITKKNKKNWHNFYG